MLPLTKVFSKWSIELRNLIYDTTTKKKKKTLFYIINYLSTVKANLFNYFIN